MLSADLSEHPYRVELLSVYLQKAVPVKVLVTQAAAAEEVCHSEDLCHVEEDLQQSRIPIITTIEGATSSEEIKPYFRGRASLHYSCNSPKLLIF